MGTRGKRDERGLLPKQAAFVREFLVDKNITQAAIRAGYSKRSAHVVGHETLNIPKVYSAIRESLQKEAREAEARAVKRGFTKEVWLKELERIAETDMDEYAEVGLVGGVRIKSSLERLPGAGKAIKKLSRAQFSESIELHDKLKALQVLGEHYGWLSNDMNLRLPDGGPVINIILPDNGFSAPPEQVPEEIAPPKKDDNEPPDSGS